MGHNTKNHREQGGDRTYIGGEVILAAGSKVTVEAGAAIEGLPIALAERAASQADSTATTAEALAVDLNALLAKLRAANLMDS